MNAFRIVLGAATFVAAVARASVPAGPPTFGNPTAINNAFLPFQPGGVKIHAGSEQGAKVVVVEEHLTATRVIRWNDAEVECRILREVEFEDGALVEISENYFAQADDGSVYYFGEVVDEYEAGAIVGHGGSWLVGGPVLPGDPPDAGNAPNPALFMPANPEVGDVFKPEDLFPVVDETAEVLEVGVTVKTAAGKFEGCIRIGESTQLSDETETKWYAPGLGVIRAKGKGEKLQLIASTLSAAD